ncbi:MAG TPA: hypothetical protein VFX37_06955 [Pseudolabrys sp.]|nr:hypothetical protein [Pseudolabrys sp.]
MASKSEATRKDDLQKRQKEGNLGQKEAHQEKRSDSELAHMGELTRSENQKPDEEKE